MLIFMHPTHMGVHPNCLILHFLASPSSLKMEIVLMRRILQRPNAPISAPTVFSFALWFV